MEAVETPDVAAADGTPADPPPRQRRRIRLGRVRPPEEAGQDTGLIPRPPDPDQPTSIIEADTMRPSVGRLRRRRKQLMASVR